MNQQCKVCGEPAAGFHFGAFTCEGCKSFFGRTYNNMSSISECKNNGDCIINKKNRTSCKSCRLRKCLLVGMSKSGSRYGRRSNWFKIHCLLQVQSSSMNAQNGLNSSMIGPNGIPLYPGFFNSATHMLNSDKFLETKLNTFSPLSTDNKRFLNDIEKYRKSSVNSGGSSTAGDIDEETRSISTTSRRAPNSHQSPSPFSDKEVSGKTMLSPNNRKTSISSPLKHTVYTLPYVPPTLRPLPKHGPSVSVTRPGITPTTNNNMIFLNTNLASPSTWSVRSGGDLLLCSPSHGGVAVEHDQPIDLSIKSCLSDKSQKVLEDSSKAPPSPIDLPQDEKETHGNIVYAPLDLTSKRHQQLTTHSS